MVLHRTYIIPHGDELISQPNNKSRQMNRRVSQITRGDSSETVVIISPHSLRISCGLPLINTEHLSGRYRIGDRTIRRTYNCDRSLGRSIIDSSKIVVETTFITGEGDLSVFPIDFGALIPLTFFKRKKIVLIGQWREPNKSSLIDFGKELYKIVSNEKKLISVVFSADQAHAHSKEGPYGYDCRAKEYDDLVIKTLRYNNFEPLIDLDDDFISGAKPDSYWNLLNFHGFIKEGNLIPIFKYYYLQKYFGMLLATAEKK